MTSTVYQDDVSIGDQNSNSTTYASEFDSLQISPLHSFFFSDANYAAPGDSFVYFTALDLGFDENEDFKLTFDDLDASEANVFLIFEDLDQTTNLLELQADREAPGGAAESENLDQVQKGSVVVEAELLDKSMDVAKEREACSDDAGLLESRDVSIDFGELYSG